MALYAAARLSLPRILDASAATGPCGDPKLAGAATGERGLRVAADGGHMAYGMPLLRGLPDIHLARKPVQQWLTTASCGESVGDLSYDVAEHVLHHLFNSGYPSVNGAKVIFDKLTSRSKCYGFVPSGDVYEHAQAMAEMNGAYCSTRRVLIGHAPNKKTECTYWPNPYAYAQTGHPGYGYYQKQQPTVQLFVGHLDLSVGDEDIMQVFGPYGELLNVKVPAGKDCGFVTYSNRASAEEAMRMLNGSQLGGNALILSWAHHSSTKQDLHNGGRRPKCFDPSDFGWSPQSISKDHGFFRFGNFSRKMMNDNPAKLNAEAFMGFGLGFKRSFSGSGGGNGGPEEFWKWSEKTYSKQFVEKLDRGLFGIRLDGPLGRIFIYALAYSTISRALRECCDLYLALVYVVSTYTPDNWDELVAGVRPYVERILGYYRELTPEPEFRWWELLSPA